jgi:hypothetical protein
MGLHGLLQGLLYLLLEEMQNSKNEKRGLSRFIEQIMETNKVQIIK